MPELPLLLRLMLPQFRTVPVDVSLALLVVVQTIPFGPFMLSFRISTPISRATPVSAITTISTPVSATISTAIVNRRRRIVARRVASDADRETGFGKQ